MQISSPSLPPPGAPLARGDHHLRLAPQPWTHEGSAPALGLSLLGFVALGAAAAAGLPASASSLRVVPGVLLVELSAMALTAPALIAVHQMLGLRASAEQLVAALGRALIHAGRVAAGLSVVVLFYAATTSLALPMMVAALVVVGVFTSLSASVELAHAEAGHAHPSTLALPSPEQLPRAFLALLIGWLGLSWAIALRVGVFVISWVVGR